MKDECMEAALAYVGRPRMKDECLEAALSYAASLEFVAGSDSPGPVDGGSPMVRGDAEKGSLPVPASTHPASSPCVHERFESKIAAFRQIDGYEKQADLYNQPVERLYPEFCAACESWSIVGDPDEGGML
jgi:hypothetical protein